MSLRTKMAIWTTVFHIIGSIFFGLGTNAFVGFGVFCCLNALDGLLWLNK